MPLPDNLRKWMPRTAALAVLLLVALPAAEFFWISLNRMAHPFELEWMEGEMALASMRWVEEGSVQALYPPFGETDFVPHLYPPLYPMAVGTLWQWFGTGEGAIPLWWGRAVSLLAVLAVLGAVALIVREGTRSWVAGFAGACAYLAFYRMSGYWYDLYRVDSAANALAMWSVYFAVRRGSGFGLLMVSFVLALAAGFAKQTALLLPMLAWGARAVWEVVEFALRRRNPEAGLLPRGGVMVHRPLALPLAVLAAGIVSANLMLVFSGPAWQGVLFYLLDMPAGASVIPENLYNRSVQDVWQHLGFPLLIPAVGAWAYLGSRSWRSRRELLLAAGGSAVAALAVWLVLVSIHLHAEAFLPEGGVVRGGLLSLDMVLLAVGTWSGGVRVAAALLAGALVLLAVRWARHRTVLPGAWWLAVLLLAQHVIVLSWVKVGGYVNNLLPLLPLLAIAVGIGFAWFCDAAGRVLGPKWRCAGGLAFLLIAAPGWFGTRELALRLSPGNELLYRPAANLTTEQARALPWWVTDGLRAHRTVTWVAVRDGERRANRVRIPFGNQIPPAEAVEWGERLLDRIGDLAREGEVYLPKQNYLATRAGLPPRPSASAIREANYLGPETPERYLQPLREGAYRYVVTMHRVGGGDSWLPDGMDEVIAEHYTLRGPLFAEQPGNAALPVTGARVRPTFVYEYQNNGEEPDGGG